jgi:putative PIN family toxin of toxin-antitoxin system
MRVVLDTNVLVRAAVSSAGPAAQLFHLIVSREDHTLVVSPALLDEVRDVLERPYFRDRIPATDREAFCVLVAAVSQMVEPIVGESIIAEDPDDDIVLYTAVSGNADAICTRNVKHFLSEAAVEFCRLQGVRVLDDLALLSELRSL